MSATAASLEALLASGEDSDVTVYVEGKAFYLHSLLLRLRSPFFKSKLSGSWNDTDKNGVVHLEESQFTFALLLPYIYTEKLDWEIKEGRPHVETWEDLLKLHSLAQFLQIDDFQDYLLRETALEKFLCTQMSKYLEYSADRVYRADQHGSIASITDVLGLEEFLKATSKDPFLMEHVDRHIEKNLPPAYMGGTSPPHTDKLDMLILADIYELGAVSKEMTRRCSLMLTLDSFSNVAFSDDNVRAKAQKWSGQRLLSVAWKICSNDESNLQEKLGRVCDRLQAGLYGGGARTRAALAGLVDPEISEMRSMREAAQKEQSKKNMMSRVFGIVNEMSNEPEAKRPRLEQ